MAGTKFPFSDVITGAKQGLEWVHKVDEHTGGDATAVQ